LAKFSVFCHWAKDKGYTNLDIRVKGFPKKQPRAYIQQTHIIDAIQRIIEHTRNSSHHGKDRNGLVLLMYDAGRGKKEAWIITGDWVSILTYPVNANHGTISSVKIGDIYYFRLHVPADLTLHMGCRQIRKSLNFLAARMLRRLPLVYSAPLRSCSCS
jgi:translation initiation factor IF-1